MADLTVRVCGADRWPLADLIDLDLFSVPERVHLARVREHTGTVEVNGLYPSQTYRVDVRPTKHRPVSAFIVGHGCIDLFCPAVPTLVSSVTWPEAYADDLTRAISAPRIAALDNERRAGLLNLYSAMSRVVLWDFVTLVTDVKPDRIYATVDPDLVSVLSVSESFTPADDSLHKPPQDFVRAGSFKQTATAYGVLQVTLFRRGHDWMADLDIDDAGGLGHVFQVLDHVVTGSATHPYDIHQLLTFHHGIDPGYRLVL